MKPFDLIKECVSKIMVAMQEGAFSMKELEFLEEYFMEGSNTTSKVIKRIKEKQDAKKNL